VTQELDQIIISSLERSFLKTDHDFVTKSEYAQNGSTATTALIMGNRLYCANVGDSRSLLCRSLNSPSSPPSLSPHSLPHSWDIVETSKQFQ
jgi:serine/threonine protein phosphatase PrpC